jgi:hypothetical protein
MITGAASDSGEVVRAPADRFFSFRASLAGRTPQHRKATSNKHRRRRSEFGRITSPVAALVGVLLLPAPPLGILDDGYRPNSRVALENAADMPEHVLSATSELGG